MKKIVYMTVIIAVLFIVAVGYAMSIGVFKDEGPEIAANAVSSTPLPDALAEAGFISYENFNEVESGTVPDRYLFLGNGEAAVEEIPANTNLSLKIAGTDTEAEQPFTMYQPLPEQSGIFTIDLKMMQPEAGRAEIIQLMSQNESVLKLQLNNGELTADGGNKLLFDEYVPGQWMAVKVVTNVETGTADVYINGMASAVEVPFSQTVGMVDGWRLSTDDTALYIGDVIIGPGKLDIPVGFATVGMLPIGGMGGETVTVATVEDFVREIVSPDPKIIYVEGEVDLGTMYEVSANKTIIGVDDSAVIRNGGLRMKNVSNVIIRNLHFINATDDAIEIRDGSTNIWVDHNSFTNAYDGALDIRKASDFVTVSWNHFYEQGKTTLVGSGDDDTGDAGHLHVTYHHNRFENTNSRNPMVRFGEGHILNNLYQNVGNYGARAYTNGSLFVEGNAFYNTKTPLEIVNGQLEERNNLFENSGDPVTEGSVFDPYAYYTYTIQPAEGVLEIVEENAGAGKIPFN